MIEMFLFYWLLPCGSYFIKVYLFIPRERVGEEQRERGRERIPGRLHAASAEPNAGLELTNREITT